MLMKDGKTDRRFTQELLQLTDKAISVLAQKKAAAHATLVLFKT